MAAAAWPLRRASESGCERGVTGQTAERGEGTDRGGYRAPREGAARKHSVTAYAQALINLLCGCRVGSPDPVKNFATRTACTLPVQVYLFLMRDGTVVSMFEKDGSSVCRPVMQQLVDPASLARESQDPSYLLNQLVGVGVGFGVGVGMYCSGSGKGAVRRHPQDPTSPARESQDPSYVLNQLVAVGVGAGVERCRCRSRSGAGTATPRRP